MKSLKSIFAVAVATLLCAGVAYGASDGSLGAASTGSSTITLDVDEVALIAGVDNVSLNYTGGTTGSEGTDPVCVYTNDAAGGTTGGGGTSTGTYKITATGNGASSAFTVAGPNSKTIPYEVTWNNTGTGKGAVSLLKGTTSDALTGAATTWSEGSGCGDPNSSYTVTFTSDDILDQPAGVYTGVLTLVVIPDDTAS